MKIGSYSYDSYKRRRELIIIFEDASYSEASTKEKTLDTDELELLEIRRKEQENVVQYYEVAFDTNTEILAAHECISINKILQHQLIMNGFSIALSEYFR